MNILFTDPVAYKPYTCETLRTAALGGSEASLLRVARALAASGCDVSVYNHIDDQREAETIDGIRHVGMNSPFPTPDVVINFRTCREMPVWESLYPNARHLMWTQDVGTADTILDGVEGREIICLTQWHKKQFEDACAQLGVKPKAVHQIYNPVEVDAEKHEKLMHRVGFFSSPHKGLSQVVKVLTDINQSRKEPLHLVIANPGYIPDASHSGANIINLGQLKHSEVMAELSKCQLLFYPQTVFPETMGIVLAEANAMGVPVLAHDMGAASEVVSYGHVLDCTDSAAVQRSLNFILSNECHPKLEPRFTIEVVTKAWKELLGLV